MWECGGKKGCFTFWELVIPGNQMGRPMGCWTGLVGGPGEWTVGAGIGA